MSSDFLIKLIVFLLPTQFGLHFWPNFSRVAGIKVDYLSPTIYLVDILLILLVIQNLKPLFHIIKKNFRFLSICLAVITTNIFFSVSPANSVSWWLRLSLYLLVFLVLRHRRLNWKQIIKPLLLSTVLLVIVEIVQFINQSSIGGFLYYFGERAFSSSTPGIGRLNLFGFELLRPPGTLSHANSLSGYLIIVFLLFSQKNTYPFFKLIPFIGILLTFSKTAVLALALIIFHLTPIITIGFSLLASFIMPLIQNLPIIWQPLSDRLFHFKYLSDIIALNPITGVGYGNFIPSLGKLLPGSFLTPSKLQPIHNLLFLIIAEMGIVGTLILSTPLIAQKNLKKIPKPEVLELIAIILFLGTLDHYFWTLPQNRLIILFALAIMF